MSDAFLRGQVTRRRLRSRDFDRLPPLVSPLLIGGPPLDRTDPGVMTTLRLPSEPYVSDETAQTSGRERRRAAAAVGDDARKVLALLANMSEGAVRNAMSDRGEGGLRASPGSKPVEVPFEEARRWLAGRRGFVASPRRLSENRAVFDRLATVRSATDLGDLVRRCLALGTVRGEAMTNAERAWADETFAFDA